MLRPLVKRLASGGDCAVADIAFCYPSHRIALTGLVERAVPETEIELQWRDLRNDCASVGDAGGSPARVWWRQGRRGITRSAARCRWCSRAQSQSPARSPAVNECSPAAARK